MIIFFNEIIEYDITNEEPVRFKTDIYVFVIDRVWGIFDVLFVIRN